MSSVNFIGLMFRFRDFVFLTPLMLSVVSVLFTVMILKSALQHISVLPANMKRVDRSSNQEVMVVIFLKVRRHLAALCETCSEPCHTCCQDSSPLLCQAVSFSNGLG